MVLSLFLLSSFYFLECKLNVLKNIHFIVVLPYLLIVGPLVINEIFHTCMWHCGKALNVVLSLMLVSFNIALLGSLSITSSSG